MKKKITRKVYQVMNQQPIRQDPLFNEYAVLIAGIFAIALVTIFGILSGHNGAMITGGIGAIAGIVGYRIKALRDSRSKSV